MTQRKIDKFIKEFHSKLPTKNSDSNKTDVYHFDNASFLVHLDSKDDGFENKRSYWYVEVVTDSFSNFGWTVPLKHENVQIMKKFLKTFL